MEGFEDFTDVPKIKDLRYEVDRVRSELSISVLKAFDEIGSLASSTANPNDFVVEDNGEGQGGFKSLAEACLVVDALGKEARDKQMSTFCEGQLRSYRKIFTKGQEHSGLDQIDRRFAWFRRLLKSIDERFKEVFPPHWHLQYKLCWMFLEQTAEGIMRGLEVRPSEERRTAGAKRQQKHYTAYIINNLHLVASLLASPIIPTLFAIRFAHRRTRITRTRKT